MEGQMLRENRTQDVIVRIQVLLVEHKMPSVGSCIWTLVSLLMALSWEVCIIWSFAGRGGAWGEALVVYKSILLPVHFLLPVLWRSEKVKNLKDPPWDEATYAVPPLLWLTVSLQTMSWVNPSSLRLPFLIFCQSKSVYSFLNFGGKCINPMTQE